MLLDDGELLGIAVHDLAAILRDDEQVFDAHAHLARQIDARLDGEALTDAYGLVVSRGDVSGLVVLQADLVTQAVRELLAVAGLLDDATGGEVNLGERHAGTHDGLGGLVGAANRLVDLAVAFAGLGAKEERARHVGAV